MALLARGCLEFLDGLTRSSLKPINEVEAALNLAEYYRQRQEFEARQHQYRNLCSHCLQPEFSCYCSNIKKINSNMKVVILIHSIEARRRIATGRMAHLCLENSVLVRGQNYTDNPQVNEILSNPNYHSMILYPGSQSKNISSFNGSYELKNLVPAGKTLALFVVDGTWATARRTLRQSQNLNTLPRICFTPPGASQFRVRKQPAPECLSTIEAIHHVIDLLGPTLGLAPAFRDHDHLLVLFNQMVDRQLEFIQQSFSRGSQS